MAIVGTRGVLTVEPSVRPPPTMTEPARVAPGRRRRPSGEAPPLPRALHTSGRWWLVATGLVLVVWTVALANLRTRLVIIDLDDAVVQRLAELRTAALTDVMLAVHALGSRWTVRALYWATVIVLLVFRRFRHLFVFIGATLAVIGLNALLVFAFMRPRPYGVEILGDWTGFAHPSQPVAVLTATLMGMLYSLAPQGRVRQLGKPAIGVLVGALSLALIYLGVNSPTDVVIAAIIGVTVPLVAFRMLAPNEVFPVTYRRGSPPGRGRPPRRGHPPRARGPARRAGAGGQAVRAVGLRRLHAAAGPRQG
jgi:membrane-associated phospholipid phosphatase